MKETKTNIAVASEEINIRIKGAAEFYGRDANVAFDRWKQYASSPLFQNIPDVDEVITRHVIGEMCLANIMRSITY